MDWLREIERIPLAERAEFARRLAVSAAGLVPGPTPGQLADLLTRLEAGRDGSGADIELIARELDIIETPGMGSAFKYDAEQARRWLPEASGVPEIVPGVRRILFRHFPFGLYFAQTPVGPAPRAIYRDTRSKLWWHDLTSRTDCPPENA